MAMNASMKGLLDQLLTGGRDLYARGEDAAAKQLGVGDDPTQRAQMRNAALGGAAATAVLGMLLGSKSGRSLAKTGLVAGGLGYLGKMAYDAYVNKSAAHAPGGTPVAALEGPPADRRAQALLAAMVAAARADGHIDADERAHIDGRLAEMAPDARAALAAELDRPLDAAAIAAMADSDQARAEIYAVSATICRADHPMERAWLDALAGALRLEPAVAREIEAQTSA
jgi:uncharacterized membrane protein YebE (DUF533 family)